MGEHKLPKRASIAAEELAKEIAVEIILGDKPMATARDLAKPENAEISFSVTFEQVWRPIKTALFAADRGVLSTEISGDAVPIGERPN